MIVYLASPNNEIQAHHCADMPVLLSFAVTSKSIMKYSPSFKRILIDSGAFSEMTTGKKIDIEAYADWAEQWKPHADAIAGLDNISGDWRQSLANYQRIDYTFPTWHDTDPIELLDDLVAMARERCGWLGIGLKPPRQSKELILRKAIKKIPDDIHLHGWALRAYTHIRRFDSVDSTNWWRDAMALRKNLPYLTYSECLEIIIKRYIRWSRIIKEDDEQPKLSLSFEEEN